MRERRTDFKWWHIPASILVMAVYILIWVGVCFIHESAVLSDHPLCGANCPGSDDGSPY